MYQTISTYRSTYRRINRFLRPSIHHNVNNAILACCQEFTQFTHLCHGFVTSSYRIRACADIRCGQAWLEAFVPLQLRIYLTYFSLQCLVLPSFAALLKGQGFKSLLLRLQRILLSPCLRQAMELPRSPEFPPPRRLGPKSAKLQRPQPVLVATHCQPCKRQEALLSKSPP